MSVALFAAIAAAGISAQTAVNLDFGWKFRWGAVKDSAAKDADFDDGGWRMVDLPHDAQFERPWTEDGSSGSRGFKPMGEMWYRKAFTFDGLGLCAEGNRVFLELGGLFAIGDVYVNGYKVASTDYGYLPVWADITGHVTRDGTNTIAVWCSTGPVGGSRWYTGAGLCRDARIVVKPQISIARHGVFVRSRAEGNSAAKVKVTVELDGFSGKGAAERLDVNVAVRDSCGAEVASCSSRAPWSKLRHQEVELPEMSIPYVKLWDVDTPNLYSAEVRLVHEGKEIDCETVRFGVRTVEFDSAYGMRLNGRKLFLGSMSNHHDLGLVGAAAYRSAIRRLFGTMKAFGYNAVRCSHNPYSEDFYDLADEMGLLVMDELTDKWSDTGAYWCGRKPFTAIWPQLMTEWMKRDRNHPSIFAWSFGNELQMRETLCGWPELGDWGVTMYRMMRELARRWDDTRPTTVAMFPARAGAITRKDSGFNDDPRAPEMALVTDFAALNYEWRAYESYLRHAPQLNIFQSEAAVKELQAPYLGMDREHSIGCSYWGAVEYWGESKAWPKKGWTYSLFSRTLEPTPAAYLIKSVMSDSPVMHIAVQEGAGEGMMWNYVKVGRASEVDAWEGAVGEHKTVRVYTNLPEVELFLNGRSLGRKQNDSSDPRLRNIVELDVPFEPGELKAVGDGATHSVRTASAPVSLAVDVEGGGWRADGEDLIHVRCRAVDRAGTQVRSATNRVTFACEGAAAFLACDNGDPFTDELFLPEVNAKSLRNGFILAVFRTGRKPGTATITITPEGLPPVTKVIECSSSTSHHGKFDFSGDS